MSTNPFFTLLQQNPARAKAVLLADPAVSTWLQAAIRALDQRDPVDVLHDLDLLLNVYEAVCDHLLGLTPHPETRIRALPPSTETPPESAPAVLDQFAAEIEIGGTLDRLLVPEFLTILAEASVGLGWETELFTPQDESTLYRALDSKRHLHLFNSFAIEGEFPELEAWLVHHQIGFTRTSAGSSTYQAERVQFRKGMTEAVTTALDPQGDDLVPRKTLLQVLRYLREGALDTAATMLERLLGPPLGALPPFRIEQTLDRLEFLEGAQG